MFRPTPVAQSQWPASKIQCFASYRWWEYRLRFSPGPPVEVTRFWCDDSIQNGCSYIAIHLKLVDLSYLLRHQRSKSQLGLKVMVHFVDVACSKVEGDARNHNNHLYKCFSVFRLRTWPLTVHLPSVFFCRGCKNNTILQLVQLLHQKLCRHVAIHGWLDAYPGSGHIHW